MAWPQMIIVETPSPGKLQACLCASSYKDYSELARKKKEFSMTNSFTGIQAKNPCVLVTNSQIM